MTAEATRYWFPAKRYGWGWGVPGTWQGRVVLLVYVAVVAAAACFVSPSRHVLIFSAVMVIATLGLLLVCLRKGEPPRWRWGGQ
ncbi:MAG: hypothetical protein KGI40_11745 [Xanthomonadaceae bacterium]|nr:hypothetical protein [Xanthomonadaceae bacterium]MDE1959740.1 hypothetical protein [Xanthomonadaceae bacterium]MDE2179147.1 hypothetical protein [Xanthomonadaceae bacterium]